MLSKLLKLLELLILLKLLKYPKLLKIPKNLKLQLLKYVNPSNLLMFLNSTIELLKLSDF